MSCPMTKEAVKKYKLSDKQVARFCQDGCSVICEELFQIYVKGVKQWMINGLK